MYLVCIYLFMICMYVLYCEGVYHAVMYLICIPLCVLRVMYSMHIIASYCIYYIYVATYNILIVALLYMFNVVALQYAYYIYILYNVCGHILYII